VQRELAVDTNDGSKVYGTLNSKSDSDRLVILVHGLSDSRNHRIVFNAHKFLVERGFDTYRPGLYSMEDGARSLEECSIGTFVEDLNSVIYNFVDDYEQIFLGCHSLGFVALDCDLSDIDGVVLWDPALSLEEERIQSMEHRPDLNAYLINRGVSFLIGEQLKRDWENINDDRLLLNLETPLKVIMAGKNDLKNAWEQKLEKLNQNAEYSVIDGASHGFTEEDVEKELFSRTVDWLTEFSDSG
jgi:pimeloyl-ACP methyl ester carboxylesterase